MRTKRMKLKLQHVGDVTFWLVMAETAEKMHKYIANKSKPMDPEALGGACCICNWQKRQIILCFNCEYINDFVISHESFHAAMWYAKLNRRKFTIKRWVNMLLEWGWEERYEEVMADVCGAVNACIWDELRPRFEFFKGEECNAE